MPLGPPVGSPAAPYVHLDAASGLPMHPAAREALLAALDDGWSDPTRLHRAGRQARRLYDASLTAIAEVLGCRPDEVYVAGSGPAAAQDAILGTLAARERVGRTFVTSAVEHSSVLHAGEWHAARGGTTELIGVDAQASVDQTSFVAAVERPGVALASLQSANGEVGTRQPLEPVYAACAAAGVPLHVDATAGVGRYSSDSYDLLTADLRALGGPPGIGLMVRRTGVRWRRPGPDPAAALPIPLVVSAAALLLAWVQEADAVNRDHAAWTTRIRTELPRLMPDVVLMPADGTDRQANIVSASFLYVDGEALVGALDARGFGVDSGSACTADTLEPSHVLVAMGRLTHGNIRLTLGPRTTAGDVDRLLAVLPTTVAGLRAGTEGL